MKKTISLFLALVLCLSMCACGNNNTTTGIKGNPNTKGNTATTATTAAATKTREEMIRVAETVDFTTVLSDYEANSVNAKAKYMEKIISFDGYVEEITTTGATVVPVCVPHSVGRASVKVYLTLDMDDIKKLTTNGVATFVGQVSDVTGCLRQSWGAGLHMDVSYYVDDMTSFEGKVVYVTTFMSSDGTVSPSIMLKTTIEGEVTYFNYVCNGAKQVVDNADLSKDDEIVISGKMSFKQYMKHVQSNGTYYYAFDYVVEGASINHKS